MSIPIYSLAGNQVNPTGASSLKGNTANVPSLAQCVKACHGLPSQFDFALNYEDDLVELRELEALRNTFGAIAENGARPRLALSAFIPATIQTGAQLARHVENDTPGEDHFNACNALLKQYPLPPCKGARARAALAITAQAAIQTTWFFKWECEETKYRPRPWEVDNSLTVLYDTNALTGALKLTPQPSPGTPRHPSYPSGHSTLGGACSYILAKFFPAAQEELDKLADNVGLGRMWAGIHYRCDHEFGLAIGRAVAELVWQEFQADGTN